MKKPMIALVPLYDEEKESYWMLPGYMKGIEEVGGIPVMLPLTTDKEVIKTLVDTYDGFLLTGGHDVNPSLYGEEKKSTCGPICWERDLMEEILFKEIVKKDKPIFGICRGLQMINVMLGGTLYQDIPTERKSDVNHKQTPPYSTPAHEVYVEKDNLLYDILETDFFSVNSYHHQAIKDLATSLLPVAHASDGIIEAAIMPNKRFVLGVQWHPEFNYHVDENNFRIFQAFVNAC